MSISSPTTLAIAIDPRGGHLLLVCVAKRTYTLREGRPKLADEQVAIVDEPALEVDAHGGLVALLDDTDVSAPKELTDVVVMGSAHSPTKVRELYAAVAVGDVAKRVRVSGERRADVGPDGAVRFSSAEPFTSAPLSFTLAYGGYDGHAHDLFEPVTADELAFLEAEAPGTPRAQGLFSYGRNPVGRAFFLDVDRARANGALLPRVEDPADPLLPERFFVPRAELWLDAPVPGGLGWLRHDAYPRLLRLVGPILPMEHERPPREAALPGGDDLLELQRLERADGEHPLAGGGVDGPLIHPRALQGASPGLAARRLRGNESVILQGLHPTVSDLRTELPGETPRVRLTPPGLKTLTPKAVLQTVRFEPDAGRFSLTWAAAVPLAAHPDDAFLAQTVIEVTFG